MIRCTKCAQMTELQRQCCSHCGEVLEYTVAEKFDMLAESLEIALKREMAVRKLRKKHQSEGSLST